MNSTDKKLPLKTILFAVLSILIILFGIYYSMSDSDAGNEPMTFEQITQLAGEYQLNNRSGINQHLSFTNGDYDYWANSLLPKKELKIQFEARKKILDSAQKNNRRIENQEGLAYEVGVLIIRNIARKYKLETPKAYNPHLILDQGDYNYWKNTNLSLEEIEKRFKTMNELLRNAEKNKVLIQSKSELGYLVEEQLKKEK